MKKLSGLVLAFCLLYTAVHADELARVGEFEGGKLYKARRLNVVVMKGNFYQMGRQYGGLLKSELKEFYDMGAKQTGLGTEKMPYDDVVKEFKAGLEKQPFYVREWVRGMGDGSGLGRDKMIIASNMLVLIVMSKQNCSGLITWGEYTKDGITVAGRNWDIPGESLVPFQKFLTVAVFNPAGSGQGVADINFIGQILWQSAMNQSGIFYDLQNGGMSDKASIQNRLNSNSALMSMMLDSTSFDQVVDFFDAVRAQGGIIINAADSKQGADFEWGSSEYRKRVDDPAGMVAASNNFIEPSWKNLPDVKSGKEGAFTKERCANLQALAKKNKGQIDAQKMMEFFDKTIPEGGPSFTKETGIKTYYTIVAVPKELRLWINNRGYQDWTEVDLKPLFKE